MKKKHKITIAIAVFLLLLPMGAGLLWPWSEFCCEHQDIDISTGKARYRKYYWFIKIYDTVKDTPISDVLKGERIGNEKVSWRRANTFTIGHGNSPHYSYHAAIFQAHEFGKYAERGYIAPDQVHDVARNILQIWQRDGDYFGVSGYLRAYWKEYLDKIEQGNGSE